MDIYPWSWFFLWWPGKENISSYKNRRKILFSILKTKEKWLSVVNEISDAKIKVDAHTKDDAQMAWNGIDDDVALEIWSLEVMKN